MVQLTQLPAVPSAGLPPGPEVATNGARPLDRSRRAARPTKAGKGASWPRLFRTHCSFPLNRLRCKIRRATQRFLQGVLPATSCQKHCGDVTQIRRTFVSESCDGLSRLASVLWCKVWASGKVHCHCARSQAGRNDQTSSERPRLMQPCTALRP